LSTPLLAGLMALVLAALFIGDHPRIARGSSRQQLVLDRAYTDQAALRLRVETLIGGSIQSLTVLKTDLVNDTTTVDVRYSQSVAVPAPIPGDDLIADRPAEATAKADRK